MVPPDYNLWSPPDYPPVRVVEVGLDLIVVSTFIKERVSWLGTSLLTLVSPFKLRILIAISIL